MHPCLWNSYINVFPLKRLGTIHNLSNLNAIAQKDHLPARIYEYFTNVFLPLHTINYIRYSWCEWQIVLTSLFPLIVKVLSLSAATELLLQFFWVCCLWMCGIFRISFASLLLCLHPISPRVLISCWVASANCHVQLLQRQVRTVPGYFMCSVWFWLAERI